jgi:hypothetical protein
MGATATESKQFRNISATTAGFALRGGRQGEIRFRKSVADFHYRLSGE